MCLAYPGTIVKIIGSSATVSYAIDLSDLVIPAQAGIHQINSNLQQVLLGDEKVKIGDHVLVQMGIVIKVISKEESDNILKVWDSIR